jgi:hypothetical protein
MGGWNHNWGVGGPGIDPTDSLKSNHCCRVTILQQSNANKALLSKNIKKLCNFDGTKYFEIQ